MIFFYIALDSWTSPKGLFRDHQTENFIANKISDIIEKIGSHCFAAVVTDNGSNIHVAQQSINHNYFHILSVHCIAHALNLLSADLVKNTSIKEILKQANMLVSFIQKSHLASRASIYNTANSIICIRPAIDKILEEQPDIFTNREVFKIVNDKNENFYTSYRKIALIFEPIKQKGKFCEICELAVNYYKGLYHSEKECRELGVIEDEYMHLQELAKTIFAIIPSQASYEEYGPNYSFYVSNVKKELSFCNNNFVEMELRNSVFNETIFAKINGSDLSEDNDEVDNEMDDKVEFENLIVNEITMALQDWVDLLNPIFGLNNSQEETVLSEEKINMKFESRSLV
ncbi:33126_t:CDS:2 [Gigaspora margarita]|uniref:33126_t:CDS:1 n=1 Tax=Gigaspora margarita TaxID=4874 RepID=A0ABN7W8A5_GIGMA|nr:33126_t:CDS:2 [Gigaspora margarita]